MARLRHVAIRRSPRALVVGMAATLVLLACGLVLPFLVWVLTIEHDALLALATTGTAVFGAVAAFGVRRFAWPGSTDTEAFTAILAGFGAFVFVGVLAIVGGVLVLAGADLCGETSPHAELVTNVVGALAYAAVGLWAFLRPGRVYVGWPLAAVAGVAALVALVAITATERAGCFN